MFRAVLFLLCVGCTVGSNRDALIETITDLHDNACPHTDLSCSAGVVNPIPINKTYVSDSKTRCCGFCECDADCVLYGSCCPKVYDSYVHAKLVMEQNRYSCVKPQYINDKNLTKYLTESNTDSIWMISKCSYGISGLIDDDIMSLCMNPGQDGSLRSVVPVSDNNQYIYRNEYCALCNGIEKSSFVAWQVKLKCSGYMPISDANFLQSLEEKRCNIFYLKPDWTGTNYCEIPSYSISKCNETGFWPEYNETIELACNAFIDPFNFTYKNYFCYLCNTRNPKPPKEWRCKTTADITNVSPDFTYIFSLDSTTDNDVQHQLRCNALSQFRDQKMMLCRDIMCDIDRQLTNLQCLLKTNSSHASPVCYQTFVKLTPTRGSVSENTLSAGSNIEFLLSVLSKFLFSNEVFVQKNQLYLKSTDMKVIEYIVVEVIFAKNAVVQEDVLVDITRSNNKTFSVLDVTYAVELALYSKANDDETVLYVPKYKYPSYDEISRIYTNRMQEGCDVYNTVSFSKLHICPFIQIGIDDWSMKIENDLLIIEEEYTHKDFPRWLYELRGTKVAICLEDFKAIYESLPSERSVAVPADAISPKQILAFVCICLSIISLLVTMAIYLLHSDLQSQPGVNNIILCLCLFFAQALYQFGAGQQSLSYWECSLIGALCHFFWLTLMFSMSSCCIQMFLIFKNPMKLTHKFRWKHTFKYILYILLASAVFVAINVTISVIKSGGKDSGYGGAVCYVSTTLMHLVTFILPSALTIVVNIGLFCYVIFKVQKTNVSSTKLNYERNYFGIYARLSTLTGLTWSLGFTLLFVDHDILEYLFIIFNASQGVFIMIAFVLNKRVFSLICKTKEVLSSEFFRNSSQKNRQITQTTNSLTDATLHDRREYIKQYLEDPDNINSPDN